MSLQEKKSKGKNFPFLVEQLHPCSTPVWTDQTYTTQLWYWHSVHKLSQTKQNTSSMIYNKGTERGSISWRRGESPVWPTQQPKPNTDGYWSGPLQLLKLRVRVLGCNAEAPPVNETSKAKRNPRRILLFICWTKSCTTIFLYICWEKFDECQLSLTLCPHSCFIQSFFCPQSLYSPEWNWHL